MGESRTRVTFGVVNILAVSVQLRMTFIDRLMKSIQTVERNILSHHSPPLAILVVYDAESKAQRNTSTIRQFIDQDPTLLVTPINVEPKYITVVRQVV